MAHIVANAPVQWWDAESVAVLCPYCNKTHRHNFGRRRIKYQDMFRLSHCTNGKFESYKLVFPFDSQRNLAHFEINKFEGRFESPLYPVKQTREATTTHAPRRPRPKFADGSKQTVFTKNYYGEKVSYEECDVEFALSACVNGNVLQVKRYLHKFGDTKDYEIFLQGEDGQGNTALCFAAIEKNPDMVKLLIQRGSEVNARNHEERTPLMEAALWTRPKNVELLLKNGADKTLRDKAGKLAFDLAQTSEENEHERHRRVPDYQEVAYKARQDRKQIALMLSEPLAQEELFEFHGAYEQGPQYNVVAGKKIALVTPIKDAEDGWDNAALLDRGRGFPEVHALQRHSGDVPETVVDGQSRVDLVAKIASFVGGNQAPDLQYFAYHAEMQLMAFFVDKHVFLPGDVVDDEELKAYRTWIDSYGSIDDPEDRRRYALAQLQRALPPAAMHRRARIVSNGPACADCEEFCRLVNKKFDLELVLQYENASDGRSLSIASLDTLCKAMYEAEPLCQSILSRLARHLGDQTVVVHSMELPSKVLENPKVLSVTALFDSTLTQFGGSKHLLMRFAVARSAVAAFQEIHVALDRLDTDQPDAWRTQWQHDVAEMKRQLAKQITTQGWSKLIRGFPDLKAKNEALMQLSHEIEKHEKDYSEDEMELLRDISKHVYNKVATPELKWFIPSHTVHKTTENSIGKGSFGEVFIGEWEKTKVVVKYVDVKQNMDNFLREVNIWHDCRHEFVVSFYGACHVHSPHPFIVCEYASNGTLRDYLYQQRELGKSLAWRKLYEVSCGLSFFHQKGYIHRDLKGDNILVTEDGKAKLADFGLSFEQSGSCQVMETWGAIRWRAPECLLGNPLVYASDVYALGMCVIDAVTGRDPWDSKRDAEVDHCLRNNVFMPKPPGICDAGWRLVEQMCEFEPSARMPLAEVVDRLKMFAEEEAKSERDESGAAGPQSTLSLHTASSSSLPSYMRSDS